MTFSLIFSIIFHTYSDLTTLTNCEILTRPAKTLHPSLFVYQSLEKSGINYFNWRISTVMHRDLPTPRPPKLLKKVPWPPPTPGIFKILFWVSSSLIHSREWFFNRNMWKNAKIAQIFITSLYSFLKIFSYTMSYDRPMLFCIVNRYPLYTLKSLWYSMVK